MNHFINLQLQKPKSLDPLIDKYGQDAVDSAFLEEMQLHADDVSREQIEKIIQNNIEDEEE